MNNQENTFEGSGNLEKKSIRGFILFYIAIVLFFLAICPRVAVSKWVSSGDFHSCTEITGSFVGILAGIACLVYFFGLSNRFFLIIGLGFFIAGSEDLIHGIFSFERLVGDTGVDFTRFVPGTYVGGRLMMAIMIIAAPILEHVMGKTKNVRREALIFSLIAIILGGGLTAVLFNIHLPQFIYPQRLISRPVDFISAILFFIGFILILRRYLKVRDIFSGWLLACILFNIGGQVYMSFSKQLYEAHFDLAHYAKIFGYLMVVLGVAMQGLEEMKKAKLEMAMRKQGEEREKKLAVEAAAAEADKKRAGGLTILNKELQETKERLEEKVHDLEVFNKIAVGRELKMKELKDRIKELEERLRGKSAD